MSWISKCSPLGVLIFILLKCGTLETTTEEGPSLLRVVVPGSHLALSGDTDVFIVDVSEHPETSTGNPEDPERSRENVPQDSETPRDLVLRILYVDGMTSESIGELPLESLPGKGENVSVIIPCGYFSRGGIYTLQLRYKLSTMPPRFTAVTGFSEIEMNSALDVKWPIPSLYLEPREFSTYPNRSVTATLKYNGISCQPAEDVPVAIYILQLIYCGSSVAACDPQNDNRAQVLYHEEIKGFPAEKVIVLKCEYFGLAGDYALRLKASEANPNAPTTSAYIKVNWSEEFGLHVRTKSIYPCDGSRGVGVLFEYPSCRLEGDRVRLYGRLRADVASLAPPSALRYVAEQKSPPGRHTLTFGCDLFTEMFIEYCFVYVSKAITGAMAEVKVVCVPTFPIKEHDAGGWGPWSAWSPCSTSCVGGVRNRYRFCDAPPPKYGARFCQGKAVETESCGARVGAPEYPEASWSAADWECRHGSELAASRPEIVAEIGPHCRCGCAVDLKKELPRKILGANTQACPGRSFWLLRVKSNSLVRLRLNQAKFPCEGQYFRVRDGDSLNANLVMDVSREKAPTAETVVSSGQSLLLEFFSDELTASSEFCVGGFLAHGTMIQKRLENTTLPEVRLETNDDVISGWIFWLRPAHLATASLLLLVFFVSIFLTLQFIFKYRKYQVAKDLDNSSDSSAGEPTVGRRGKAMSSMTLISEVASLVGFPRKSPGRATKSKMPYEEDGYDSSETLAEYEDESTSSSGTVKLKDEQETLSERSVVASKLQAGEILSSMSNCAVIGPEIKYARPVKLRTLGSESTTEPPESQGAVPPNPTVREKELPAGIAPSPLQLPAGKETKDRRNRERLLRGPGSEFSLSNTETDLEMDYYDYNVANASAVPGSYLGMDPAFLIWIPPLLSGESEDAELPKSDSIKLETEGASLTPSEYKRMKNQSEESKTEAKRPLQPVHRILEDSRIRVSEESLAQSLKEGSPRNIIPNRLHELSTDTSPEKSRSFDEQNFRRIQRDAKKSERKSRRKDARVLKKGNKREERNENFSNLNVLAGQDKVREFSRFAREKLPDPVNIPMTEFGKSRGRQEEIQSPDYGVEMETKESRDSFYDLIRADESAIKFADDDEDDEFLDNKVTA